MSGQTTIKVRTDTKDRLDILARHYATSVTEVVNCAVLKMLEHADNGMKLEIAMAKTVDDLARRVSEMSSSYGQQKKSHPMKERTRQKKPTGSAWFRFTRKRPRGIRSRGWRGKHD